MSTYTKVWDTTKVVNGAHTIDALITDTGGNKVSTSTISINVDNPVTQPPPPVTTKSIRIINPKLNEMWKSGRIKTINWQSANVSGNVKIELLKDGVAEVIFSNVVDKGTINWVVTTAKHSDYVIRVTNLLEPDVFGESGFFRVN